MEQTLDNTPKPKIQIEVVYGTPEKQVILTITVPDDYTVEQAIEASDIKSTFKEIDLSVNKVGIWNRTAKLTDTLQDFDRIEIYRPLIADPKEVRKRRAEKAKNEGRADKVTGGRVNPLRGSNEK
ncbi:MULTISPECIES: RnfH family protein [Thalassotalea]|uniref:RnfH family protein n=1 Tax=Thalassotalea sp. PP2-459 TaxID=1742724 RepID=UPI0009438220|nr:MULTISPECIES: RnfH family protein [Thalassotalea]OKY27663.1 RnfH family protein [Thalassotalea sp. PP2-459]